MASSPLAYALLVFVSLALCDAKFGGCTDGIKCISLSTVSNLTFECRVAGGEHTPNQAVMLLHGFPEWSSMYMPLMRILASHGYPSMACNQRGYSPGARPSSERDYNYNLLANDVWELAAAANITHKFHLVGHDHGGMLGWTVAASQQGAARLLSYTSLSIPHPRAFGDGLFGPGSDVAQQVASQYFTMFTMNNSATMDFELLYRTAGKTGGPTGTEDFDSAEDFQKALWWYNGAMDAGVLAMPPLFSAKDLLLKYKSAPMATLRAAFSGCDRCKQNPEGFPASNPVGNVSVPSLFVCGAKDSSILCDHQYALKSQDYCTASYQYLKVDCGHEVLTESASCSASQVSKVTDAILAIIETNGE